MVAGERLAEFLREQLALLGRVTMRRMFGKTGVFCDGLMLGMVMANTLYLRVDDHNRAARDGDREHHREALLKAGLPSQASDKASA